LALLIITGDSMQAQQSERQKDPVTGNADLVTINTDLVVTPFAPSRGIRYRSYEIMY
jgi:hypothetical protein